jgi:transposase InsO family protein
LVNRTASRYEPVKRADEDEIREKIIYLACNFGRVGYRMVTNMLRNDGFIINHKRVERIWREEGLKLPKKQTKKRRLWMKDGSCVRLRAEHRNHVWSYDFVEDKTAGGRKIRWLNIIDESTHECLFSQPKKYWKSIDVIDALAGIMISRGCPEYIRSDNGAEFTANKLRDWLKEIGVITAYIEPGSSWENGYCESSTAGCATSF